MLETAWRRVQAKAGAPGIDGVTIESLSADAQVEAAWLAALRDELHTKKYRPAPVRRVKIPKASGGLRSLGIPTVRDRVVQMAVYLVLMPIFEADFHPQSYGFRPKRDGHQAVEAIKEGLYSGRTEVVDADLAQYFDTIPHRPLMRAVARRVSDGMILKLIKAWLRAPIAEEEEGGGTTMKANPCGTPQGGVISPLLANIYLDPLDRAVNDQCGQKYRMVRYADDLVILCGPGQGAGVKERLAQWLQAKGLRLNENKTRVLQSRESGFEFVGFSFRWQKSRKGCFYVHTSPRPAAQQSLRDRIRTMTQRWTRGRNPHVLVREINQVTRGWEQYFATGHYTRTFKRMNYFIAERMRYWFWRKHDKPSDRYERWSDEVLVKYYGLHRLPCVEF
jgi:group II intron reverse transcriptase/maturase